MINPKLKPGDRVVLLHMGGETSVLPGTWGTVTKSYELFGTDQYDVKWDNGSSLSLIGDEDMWDNKERTKEHRQKYNKQYNEDNKEKRIQQRAELFVCECGQTIAKSSKSKHIKGKPHLDKMAN